MVHCLRGYAWRQKKLACVTREGHVCVSKQGRSHQSGEGSLYDLRSCEEVRLLASDTFYECRFELVTNTLLLQGRIKRGIMMKGGGDLPRRLRGDWLVGDGVARITCGGEPVYLWSGKNHARLF